METKEVVEAKKIVESVANILSGIRKIEFAREKLVKLDKVYHYSRDFKASKSGRIELETTTGELVKGNIIRSGVYFITNIWIFKDEIYDYLVSFVFRTGERKEVIVYGKGIYSLVGTVLYQLGPKELFFVFACNGKTRIKNFPVDVNVANIYKLKGMYVYELHNQVVEFLDSFWFKTKCEAQTWLSVKEQFKI
jgi:hypothetical protein